MLKENKHNPTIMDIHVVKKYDPIGYLPMYLVNMRNANAPYPILEDWKIVTKQCSCGVYL